MWFSLVILMAVTVMAFGPGMTVGTGALLLALSLVPAAIVLALWPAAELRTAADVLYSRDRST
jgi:hypothetical protein